MRNTIDHLQLPIVTLGFDHTLGAVAAVDLVNPSRLHWHALYD